MTTASAGEDDFMEALEVMGGCPHIGTVAQRLDTICDKCRGMITKLVLLRDHYERDRKFFEGVKK